MIRNQRLQELKSKVFEKYRSKTIMQHAKALIRSPAFKLAVETAIYTSLILWIDMRPLGLIFLILLICWLALNLFDLNITTSPVFKQLLSDFALSANDYKNEHPFSYYIGLFMVYVGMLLLANAVMFGLVASFALLFTLLKHFEAFTVHTRMPFANHSSSEDYGAYIPGDDADNLEVLSRATTMNSTQTEVYNDNDYDYDYDYDHDNDDYSSDEVPLEFLLPDPIPEIDDEQSTDEDQDLLPLAQETKSETNTKNYAPGEDVVVQYVQLNGNTENNEGLFENELNLSSSASEESLSKGLQFPDHSTVDKGTNQIIPAHGIALGTAILLRNMLGAGTSDLPTQNEPRSGEATTIMGNENAASSVFNMLHNRLSAGTSNLPIKNNRISGEASSDTSSESEFEFIGMEDCEN